jgi:hypothetical protein
MFILPGILGLVTLIFARPFEFVEILQGMPFLYIFFGLAVFGYAIDLRLGFSDVRSTPALPWAVAFITWCAFTGLLKDAADAGVWGINLAVFFALFFLVAHGVRTLRAFESLVAVLLACSIWVAAACVYQGLSPFQCIAVPPGAVENSTGTPDGRPCEDIPVCYINPPDPEALYRCEHAGLLGTTSIGRGRVRYVGVLQDPNEAALAVSVAVPLAFAFFQRRRTKKRLALLIVTLVLVAMTVIMSQSRGGQLVFLAVIGMYFVRRYGWRGAVAGAVLSSPMLLLGGRSGEEASSSSTERLECWYAGTEMFKQSPFVGVGFGQFTAHHHLTAHNSFVLAPAELGMPGMLIWVTVLYLSMKIPLQVMRDMQDIPEAQPALTWAMALLSSMVGMLVGVFFLSFNYHYVLWLYFGLSGALYLAVQAHRPSWSVKFGWADAAIVGVASVAVLVAVMVYTRMKLG